MKIKEKVLKEVVRQVIHLESKESAFPKVIDLTLAEVSKCSVCKKNKPFDFLIFECPDCYLKGCKKELKKQKAEVKKVIDDLEREEWGDDVILVSKLKQKLNLMEDKKCKEKF